VHGARDFGNLWKHPYTSWVKGVLLSGVEPPTFAVPAAANTWHGGPKAAAHRVGHGYV
jgi:hypothetical protein